MRSTSLLGTRYSITVSEMGADRHDSIRENNLESLIVVAHTPMSPRTQRRVVAVLVVAGILLLALSTRLPLRFPHPLRRNACKNWTPSQPRSGDESCLRARQLRQIQKFMEDPQYEYVPTQHV